MPLYRSALFQKSGLLLQAFAMTRHKLAHDRYAASVGWDASLDTFFACVEDPTADEEEGPLLWLGSLPGEYRGFESFRAAFERQLSDRQITDLALTDEVARLIQADYAAAPPGTGMARKSAAYQGFLSDWHGAQ